MSSEKILGGALLVVVGLYLLWNWFGDFLTVLKGTVPVLLAFVGAILLWVESEEMKLEKPKRKKK